MANFDNPSTFSRFASRWEYQTRSVSAIRPLTMHTVNTHRKIYEGDGEIREILILTNLNFQIDVSLVFYMFINKF